MNRKITVFFLILCAASYSQISLTGTGLYTQNFNSLSNTGTSADVPAGWFFNEEGNNADSLYSAGIGSDNSGNTYSFGPDGGTDRALGTLRDNKLTSMIGAQFINNTGNEITQIPVSYTGEQWRRGFNVGTDRLDFQISTDASSLNSGTWTDIDNLDFASQNLLLIGGALDGNLSANRAEISYTIANLNIADGQTFWIRWVDFNLTGISSTDDGLSIDDFSIDQTALPVELVFFTGSLIKNLIQLKWQTATEVDNYGFEIERSRAKLDSKADPLNFENIAFVKGNGNSNSIKNYLYEDNTFSEYGKYFYRLKQIDNDGDFSYSKIIEVNISPPHDFSLEQNHPNPFNPATKIAYSIPGENSVNGVYHVTLKIYNVLGNELATLINENKVPGRYETEFDGTNFPSGVYYYKLQMGSRIEVRKMLLLK
jgi:hypothetical protein